MNKSAIQDHGLITVTLNGRSFAFHADSDFAARAAELAEEAEKKAAESRQGLCDYDEIAAFLSYVIDSLLGDGAVDDLYGEDDTPDVFTLLFWLDEIIAAFHRYRVNRLSRLKGKEAAS